MAWRGWKYDNPPYEEGVLNEEKAYEIIVRKFDEFLEYDDYNLVSLTYYVKMLFENGRVYISDSINNPQLEKEQRYGNRGKGNIWEHMVPTDVLISYALFLYEKKEFSLEKYHFLHNTFGNVCVITREEDKRLTKAHYRQNMPSCVASIEEVPERLKDKGVKKVYVFDDSVCPFCRYQILEQPIQFHWNKKQLQDLSIYDWQKCKTCHCFRG